MNKFEWIEIYFIINRWLLQSIILSLKIITNNRTKYVILIKFNIKWHEENEKRRKKRTIDEIIIVIRK